MPLVFLGGILAGTFGVLTFSLLPQGAICLFTSLPALVGLALLIAGIRGLFAAKGIRSQEKLAEKFGEVYAREIREQRLTGQKAIAYLKEKGLTDLHTRQQVLKIVRNMGSE
ncbi:MAG: hypothetical protein ACYTHM_03010 [Planctomycetota bacterium]|jgi:hypothetical protein